MNDKTEAKPKPDDQTVAKLRSALEKALLFTDPERDVGEWRAEAYAALGITRREY